MRKTVLTFIFFLVVGPTLAQGVTPKQGGWEVNFGVVSLWTKSGRPLGEYRAYVGYSPIFTQQIGMIVTTTPIYPEWSGYGVDTRSIGIFYRYSLPLKRTIFSPFVALDANLVVTDRHKEYRDLNSEVAAEVGLRILPWDLGEGSIGFAVAPRWQRMYLDGPGSFGTVGISVRFVFISVD